MEDMKTLGEGTIPEPDRATPRKKRSTMGRILQITGLVFIAAALALGGYIWWNLWGTGFATQRAQEDLRPAFERNLASLAPADAPDRVVKVPGHAVAIIRIPKIDVDYVVVEGTDTEALKKGPGHYSDTAYPWQDDGRVGIAGHRTTYGAPFRRLDQLGRGDRIEMLMPYGRFTYTVERTRIVPPTATWVTNRAAHDRLVLTACHPLYSAAQRIVVFARLSTARARGATA